MTFGHAMNYSIFRVQKLKSATALRGSLKHAFREQDTPNADPSRISHNSHFGAASVAEAMAGYKSRLPEKVRANAVHCIEYLITASPEILKQKTRAEQDAYFDDALAWIRERHGAENVIYAGVHRDETTPHLYCYAVPIDEKGKLNCRQFLGGTSHRLSELQTKFSSEVGERHGLQRGLEGSKAKHVDIKDFYQQINKPTPKIGKLEIPPAGMAARLNPVEYGQQVAEAVTSQIKPTVQNLHRKALQADLIEKEAKQVRQGLEAANAAKTALQNENLELDARAREQAELLETLNENEIENLKKRRKERMEIEEAKPIIDHVVLLAETKQEAAIVEYFDSIPREKQNWLWTLASGAKQLYQRLYDAIEFYRECKRDDERRTQQMRLLEQQAVINQRSNKEERQRAAEQAAKPAISMLAAVLDAMAAARTQEEKQEILRSEELQTQIGETLREGVPHERHHRVVRRVEGSEFEVYTDENELKAFEKEYELAEELFLSLDKSGQNELIQNQQIDRKKIKETLDKARMIQAHQSVAISPKRTNSSGNDNSL